MQIHHVLVGRRMATRSLETVEVDGSDHRAVVAELALK